LDNIAVHVQWLEGYTGDYLFENDYWWAESERQRLRDVWYKHAMAVGQAYQDANLIKEALEHYETFEKKFPFTEEIYFMIMKIHAGNGDLRLSGKKYEQLREMLQEEYGIQPSASIRQWAEEVLN
jgi:two-component SAPR family response regulator